jgi:Domain of unknown function (DUF5110)
MDPVRQYTDEPTTTPTTLVVYPGADGESTWYEDDGSSFDYRRGGAMRIMIKWNDASRRLSLRLAPGFKLLAPTPRPIDVRVAGSTTVTHLEFTGRPVELNV